MRGIEQVMRELRERIGDAGSLRKAAKKFGVSAAFLSDVMRGNRRPGPKLLGKIGFREDRTVTYTYWRCDR